MDAAAAPSTLVVIVGPQASGKSTVAAALGAAMRADGVPTAVVALDEIAAMALPTLPSWEVAHRIFESVTGHWLSSGLACVIAEGSGSSAEVAGLHRQAPLETAVVAVATTAPFDVALARAQADPTRGVSNQRDFLRRVYDQWPSQLAAIAPDLLIDTSTMTVDEAVRAIGAVVTRAHGDRSRTGREH